MTNEEFQKHLEETYPKMFARQYGGVAVGDGWLPIIQVLCSHIQTHIDWRNKTKEGSVTQVVVEQIKEKFGGLRFYYQGGDDYIDGLVSMAESWAARTCETCGNLGSRRSGGWVRTLCDEHEQEYQNRKNS
jgi:hypothetical protein